MPAELTILVPLYNEAENLGPLVKAVTKAFTGHSTSYELVLVDDGSRDGTWDAIRQASQADVRVRGIRHRSNAGQSAALWTGIRMTRTPLIATLDGDLQNDPADIPKFLSHLDEVDFVCGHRTNRQDTWLRRISSRIAFRARKAALGSGFQDTGCALRVFKRSAIADVFPFNGWHRFLPIVVHGSGHTTLEVPVQHHPRHAGVSKYGVWNRLGRGLWDLVGVRWYLQRRLPHADVAEDNP